MFFNFRYLFPLFTLCWTEFLGMLVRIPCNTEEYLVANYGPNWFVPQKKWAYTDSPPNVVANGRWPESEWPEVLQIFQWVFVDCKCFYAEDLM